MGQDAVRRGVLIHWRARRDEEGVDVLHQVDVVLAPLQQVQGLLELLLRLPREPEQEVYVGADARVVGALDGRLGIQQLDVLAHALQHRTGAGLQAEADLLQPGLVEPPQQVGAHVAPGYALAHPADVQPAPDDPVSQGAQHLEVAVEQLVVEAEGHRPVSLVQVLQLCVDMVRAAGAVAPLQGALVAEGAAHDAAPARHKGKHRLAPAGAAVVVVRHQVRVVREGVRLKVRGHAVFHGEGRVRVEAEDYAGGRLLVVQLQHRGEQVLAVAADPGVGQARAHPLPLAGDLA